jgi:signal peptide peptidase SppA
VSDNDKQEFTPGAALAELEGHVWALRPEVFGQLVSLAQAGRLVESFRADAAHVEDMVVITAEELEVEAARRGRPKTIQGGIARIPLKGVLMPVGGILAMLFGIPDPITMFRGRLQQALEDPDIGGVVMDIDSPGGVVDQIPELAAEIREAAKSKPITAIANVQAASAAYWLGSQASEFVVTPSGDAGSIGVYATHQDLSGRAEQLGVKVTLVSAGKYKTEGNPYEALGDEARAHIQEDVDTYYDMFTTDVALGRSAATSEKVKKSDVVNGYGEGRSLTAKAAVEAKIADRVESIGGMTVRLLSRSRDPLALAAEAEAGAALANDEEAEADAGAEDRAREKERAGAGLFALRRS